MFGRLFPREERFFDQFCQASDLLVEGAKEFSLMLANLNESEMHTRKIHEIEHKADMVTHHVKELLHKTFITPLDREEILVLSSRLDDIVDYIQAAAERVYLYKITSVPPEMIDLANICVKCCEDIRFIMSRLENLKDPTEILKSCVEINRLENEADIILRTSMAKLYHEEPDLRRLLMLKEIFNLLEIVTDHCEDVADVVEGIVLEHS